jgi:hypothetical protein
MANNNSSSSSSGTTPATKCYTCGKSLAPGPAFGVNLNLCVRCFLESMRHGPDGPLLTNEGIRLVSEGLAALAKGVQLSQAAKPTNGDGK